MKCEDCGKQGAGLWGNGRSLCVRCKMAGDKEAAKVAVIPPLEQPTNRKRTKSRAVPEKSGRKRQRPRTCGVCGCTEWTEPKYLENGQRLIQHTWAPWVEQNKHPFVICSGMFESPSGKKEYRCIPCQRYLEQPQIDPLKVGRQPPRDATMWVCGYAKDLIGEKICWSRQNGGGYKRRGRDSQFPKQCCTRRCPLFNV